MVCLQPFHSISWLNFRSHLLKAHAAFTDFITTEVQSAAGKAGTQEEIIRLQFRKGVIDDVAKGAGSKGSAMWRDVNKRMSNFRTKTELHKITLHKSDMEEAITNCVSNWNKSPRYAELQEEVIGIHRKIYGEDKVKPTSQEYDKVVNLAHGVVSMANAGRAGTMGKVKNIEYCAQRKVAQGEDFGIVEGDGKQAIGVIITVLADEESSLKTHNNQLIFISSSHLQLVELYLDVRKAFYKGTKYEDEVKESESPLFISSNRKPIIRPRASIMDEVSKQSGLPNVTSNTIR